MEVRVGRDCSNRSSSCHKVSSFSKLLAISKRYKFVAIINKATFQYFGWVDVDCKRCKKNSKPCSKSVKLSARVVNFFLSRSGCIIRGKSCGFHALYKLNTSETLDQSWAELERLNLPNYLQIDRNCECIAVPGSWGYKRGARRGLTILKKLWQLETQYDQRIEI